MDNLEIKLKVPLIVSVLENSDIVWPKYGKDTIEELANRIADKLIESSVE